jgi:threonine/homoserine/homoserine lactone efflux protein
MIDWVIFLPACFALNLAFGPNNLLALMHGARAGVGFAQCAALGRLLVFLPMIAVSALGLGFVLTTSALVFSIVKVIGAAYLIWLGISLWRSSTTVETERVDGVKLPLRRAFRSEAVVALSNPKAILIFAAFFPQFVAVDAYWHSYAMLGAAFIGMEAIAICIYALIGRFASKFATGKLSLMQRASGLTMGLFGLLLLMSPSATKS